MPTSLAAATGQQSNVPKIDTASIGGLRVAFRTNVFLVYFTSTLEVVLFDSA